MLKLFFKWFVLIFAVISFSIFAQDASKLSKPTSAEKERLEKIITPHFQQMNPKITDIKTFGTGLIVAHLSVRAADHSDAFVIISPDNKVIDIDDYAILSNIDIKKNPTFPTLAEKTPNISIWPGNHDFPTFERLADGAQQIQFNYRLLNGCHACAVGGVATVGFNFDVKGNFIGVTLIKLLPPPNVNE